MFKIFKNDNPHKNADEILHLTFPTLHQQFVQNTVVRQRLAHFMKILEIFKFQNFFGETLTKFHPKD